MLNNSVFLHIEFVVCTMRDMGDDEMGRAWVDDMKKGDIVRKLVALVLRRTLSIIPLQSMVPWSSFIK